MRYVHVVICVLLVAGLGHLVDVLLSQFYRNCSRIFDRQELKENRKSKYNHLLYISLLLVVVSLLLLVLCSFFLSTCV